MRSTAKIQSDLNERRSALKFFRDQRDENEKCIAMVMDDINRLKREAYEQGVDLK
mgnify:CR=1 FL=1